MSKPLHLLWGKVNQECNLVEETSSTPVVCENQSPQLQVLEKEQQQIARCLFPEPSGLFNKTPLVTGTRIVYERAFLMQLRNSPMARTPPKNIPSALIRGGVDESSKENLDVIPSPTKTTVLVEEDENQDQFQLEM